MELGKYSFGIGDRFGRQGVAQLSALIKAKQQAVNITPVWNKSYREHSIIGTMPADVRKEADAAVAACRWDGAYFVDADHIGLNNVDQFIEASDYFTLDVAEFIGKRAADSDIQAFVKNHKKYIGISVVDAIDRKMEISEKQAKAIASKYLLAVKEAGRIYRHIEQIKGATDFIIEVSMDETDQPQSPVELFFILAAIANEGIPAATIAPKFTGRFNKGVDYVGDVTVFAKEFEQDIAVIEFAKKEFGLARGLKLSVHSGSDKFSIYPAIKRALKKFDAGLHIKTAGTTWLEELIGLAMAGGEGLSIAKEIYSKAIFRIDELCRPYATVIDIDRDKLPPPNDVNKWDGQRFALALRHPTPIGRSIKDIRNADRKIDIDSSIGAGQAYNPHFRQLLHIGYKMAAEMGQRYLDTLEKYEDIVAQNVIENLYERHIRPIFVE